MFIKLSSNGFIKRGNIILIFKPTCALCFIAALSKVETINYGV